MPKTVIISGATGFIGKVLIKKLVARSCRVVVLSRNPGKAAALRNSLIEVVGWDGKSANGWAHYADGAYGIVNLAGENIAAGRWTPARKTAILQSRLAAGRAIVEAVAQAAHKPRVVIQASGIGYYGNSGDTVLDETSSAGTGFLADVAMQWERSTDPVAALGVRRVIIRTGVVLGRGGGFLSRVLLPFKLFMGGYMGSGRQWFSWIHMEDEVSAICFLLEQDAARGAFNLSAPQPLTAKDFFSEVGRTLNRPSWLPVPGFALRLALGEMAEELILSGQRALPKRLLTAGYAFHYPLARDALQNILSGR
jgi:uncharacterized protein (TIGR01777 family)